MRDYDIRTAIKEDWLKSFREDGESIILDEIGVNCGFSRIDVAVINCALHGFEIKSERDDLRRLESQVGNYTKVFDYLSVVTSGKHFKRLEEYLPEYFAIIVASPQENGVSFTVERDSTKNPCTDSFSTAQLLWREECLEILSEHNLIRGNLSKRKWLLWEKIAESFDKDQVSSLVRSALKKRYRLNHIIE